MRTSWGKSHYMFGAIVTGYITSLPAMLPVACCYVAVAAGFDAPWLRNFGPGTRAWWSSGRSLPVRAGGPESGRPVLHVWRLFMISALISSGMILLCIISYVSNVVIQSWAIYWG